MAYNPINWEDYPSEKTPVTAQALNHMDMQIKANADAIVELSKGDVTTLTGTLSKNATQLIFTSNKFTANSEIKFLTQPYGYSPIGVTEDLANNRIITNWRALQTDIKVKCKISN